MINYHSQRQMNFNQLCKVVPSASKAGTPETVLACEKYQTPDKQKTQSKRVRGGCRQAYGNHHRAHKRDNAKAKKRIPKVNIFLQHQGSWHHATEGFEL